LECSSWRASKNDRHKRVKGLSIEPKAKTKVLVTGGSGFIGVNLTKFLLEKDFEVLNLDLKPPLDSSQSHVWTRADILDLASLTELVKGFKPNFVFHLAARTDLGGKSISDYLVNTKGVENLISALSDLEVPVRKTTYFSSRLVFKNGYQPSSTFDYAPSTIYGESKISMEKIIVQKASEASDWTILRPTSIWGPWFETPYRDFFDQVSRGRFVKVFGHNPLKSFGFVGNAVDYAYQIGIEKPHLLSRDTYWLCDPEPIALNHWSELISKHLNVKKPGSSPLFLLRAVAFFGDWVSKGIWKSFPLTSFRLKNLLTNMVYDTEFLRDLSSARTVSLEESIAITARWYLSSENSKRL
jgi:nucleoside-diphosphate-sugar epimerase